MITDVMDLVEIEEIIPFNFQEEECDFLITTRDENIKLPKHFMQHACENFSSFSKEIDLSNVSGENLITALSFYRAQDFKKIDVGKYYAYFSFICFLFVVFLFLIAGG